MGLEDLKAKILSYLEEVQVASRNDIADHTGASGRTLTKTLNELVGEGSLEVIGERPLTYKFVKKNVIQIDLSKIEGYDQLKYEIAKNLVDNGWLVSTHALAVISLMYAKFTKFRTLIFGSQGIGKTSTILTVFRELKEPIIIQDLHLKNLYDVVSSVKNNTKVIEEQYRHNWGKELLSRYDKYRVVPISRIAPAELLFRFIPIRILHPLTNRILRSFQQVYFEFLNCPQKLYEVDGSLSSRFLDELNELKYFTIDVKALAKYDLKNVDEDFFKEIYEEIVERAQRHRLGEYYTPEWTAELTIKEALQYFDNDNTGGIPKILDPACGSGTFLQGAIKILKRKLELLENC